MNHALRRALLALLLVAGIGVMTACATYATPTTDQIGLAYTGGDWDAKAFQKCVEPGGNEAIDNYGDVYYYPIGTRTWDFSMRPGADSLPIAVSTQNNQELFVSGTITFALNTACTGPDGKEYRDPRGRVWPGGPLQSFHEQVGRGKAAFFSDDSTIIPAGWRDTLGLYLGGPANRAMDQTGSAYTWQDLYSDKRVADQFTKAVQQAIPALLQQQTGGEQFFNIVSVQLDKPDVPPALKTEQEAKERAIIAQGTADQQKRFAEQFPGGLPGYAAYLESQARIRCFDVGKCSLVPSGASSVAVGG